MLFAFSEVVLFTHGSRTLTVALFFDLLLLILFLQGLLGVLFILPGFLYHLCT